jgi:hypothetical protein
MDIVEIKQEINKIQLELLGRQIDVRTLSYWTNIITSGTGDIENFIENIVFSEEYKINVSSSFRDLFYSLIGFINIDIYIESFNQKVNRFIQENKKPFGKFEILKFITSLDCYQNKYHNMIKKEYNRKFIEDCSPTFVNVLMNKFENEFDFDTNLLLKDIEEYKPKYDTKDDITSIVRDNVDTIILDVRILEDFYKIFKRPMFVEEYFYYFGKCSEGFSDIYKTYTINYNKFTKITRDYKNSDTSEYAFVKEYIQYIGDNDAFFANIIDNLVNTEEYKIEMKNIITRKYYEIYSESLEKDDLDYYFKMIKELKIHLDSDVIEAETFKLKKETDIYINSIFGTYINIVDRKPDIHEVSIWLTQYRDMKDTLVVEILLEKELIKSLEFNEIIKKKIQQKYNIEMNADIMPSLLYKEINNVVKQINLSELKYDCVCDLINNIIF